MRTSWAALVALVGMVAACAGSDSKQEEPLGVTSQALSSGSVLGFESASGWSTSAGSLSLSSQASEGSSSLALSAPGYAQLTSVPLTSLGQVGNQLTLDLRLGQGSNWGEVRVIVKVPSLGEHWRDLGGKPVTSLTPNTFHRLSFTLPPDLKTKLSSHYNDLTFLITVNAPSGTYAFDRLDLGAGPQPPPLHNTTYSFNIVLPSGVNINDVAVAAKSELKLSDRTQINRGTTPIGVFNATGHSELGADSVVGGLISGGNAFLRSRARVSGDVRVAGTITKQDSVVITGAQLAQQTITTQTVSWVERPPRAMTSVSLEPDRSKVIVPGAYGSVVVKSRAKLFLPSGKYFFDSLQIEPQAEIVLQDTSGPIFIYVKDSFTHRGKFRGLGAKQPDLLVGYVGTGTVLLEAAFPGTFVAPNGTLRLQPAPAGGHTGAFYAKALTVEPDARVNHRSFPWAVLIPPDTSNAPIRKMTPSPVVLRPSRSYDPPLSRPGTADPPTPITFEIPKMIPVTGGNAGNGLATLGFTDQNGARVTCQYRGRSSTAHPTGTLELARGLYYVFEACSNGLTAGNEAQGTDFELEINGDSEYQTPTEAELALGKGTCSGKLDPLITPEQSQQMVQSFSWAHTQALPETNPEGLPSLYYANIYIRNEDERKLLKRFFIHHQVKPIFVDELSSYKGKCGSFEHAGDGVGQFVFAVIPAATYNRIRAATTHPDIPAAQRVIFQAIVLRQAPASAVHPDGSLRYGPLQEAGFYYMNLRDMPPLEALSEELLGSDPVSAFVDSIEFVVEVAYTVGTTIVRVLGSVDRWLFGDIAMVVDLEVLNRDPAFERSEPMQYGYGPQYTPFGVAYSLGIPGVQVEVLQWAVRPLGVYPTNYYAHTGGTGVAMLRVGKSNGGFGGDVSARGDSGICIEMKNHAAEFISGLLPNEVCDFREAPEFEGFEEDIVVTVQTDDYDAHALAQSTEAWDYIAAAGHFPRMARVLTGHTAAVVSSERSGKRKLWTPCLGYGGVGFTMTQLVASGAVPWVLIGGDIANGEFPDDGVAALFGAPWYLGRLAESDIVMPRNSNASESRGMMVHEYAHFISCSMMNEHSSDSLATLTVDVVLCGDSVDADDEARYMTEAFADFITGQVVGGTNYFTPVASTTSGAIAYCNGSGRCLDNNFSGSASGGQQINRVVTLYQDAFDGATTRGTLPTNGDSFSLQTSPTGATCSTGRCFRPALSNYGSASDEQVALPVSAIPVWFFHWMIEANVFNALREEPVMKGLGTTMKEYGYNWCQACEVFANHSPLSNTGTLQDKFQACLQGPIADYLPDDAPEASGRIQASDCTVCPAGTISGPDGTCTACAAGEEVVGNVCSPCLPGQVVSAAGVCTSCLPNEIVVSNTCTACAIDQVPDTARTACLVCPVDVTVDWRVVPNTCDHSATLLTGAIPLDICPERFIVNLTNLDDVFNHDPDAVGVTVDVMSESNTPAACAATLSRVDFGVLSSGGLSMATTNTSSGGWIDVADDCLHQESLRFITAEQIDAGTTSRGLVFTISNGGAAVPATILLTAEGLPPGCTPG